MLDQAKTLLTQKGHKDLTRLSYREVRHKGRVVAHLFRLGREAGRGSLRWQGVVDDSGTLVSLQPISTTERKHVKQNPVRQPVAVPANVEYRDYASRDHSPAPQVVQRRGHLPEPPTKTRVS
jgi:hypothetical protein